MALIHPTRCLASHLTCFWHSNIRNPAGSDLDQVGKDPTQHDYSCPELSLLPARMAITEAVGLPLILLIATVETIVYGIISLFSEQDNGISYLLDSSLFTVMWATNDFLFLNNFFRNNLHTHESFARDKQFRSVQLLHRHDAHKAYVDQVIKAKRAPMQVPVNGPAVNIFRLILDDTSGKALLRSLGPQLSQAQFKDCLDPDESCDIYYSVLMKIFAYYVVGKGKTKAIPDFFKNHNDKETAPNFFIDGIENERRRFSNQFSNPDLQGALDGWLNHLYSELPDDASLNELDLDSTKNIRNPNPASELSTELEAVVALKNLAIAGVTLSLHIITKDWLPVFPQPQRVSNENQ